MARWNKLNTRGQVDDRRSLGPAAIGGVGIAGVALMVALQLLTGGDLVDVVTQLESLPLDQLQSTQANLEFEGDDSYEVFASTVLGSTNELWNQEFERMGERYIAPTLVLFRHSTQSGCGIASSQVGPHYCSLDSTIYLDETFFDELTIRLGARGGDVAEAYVIAHEAAHHVQYSLGLLDSLRDIQQSQSELANQASIALELQADCFADMWAYSIKDQGVFEPGEIIEAMDAAAAVGDDRIQAKTTGQINPETWTHGSSSERRDWFNQGYEQGTYEACQLSLD